MQNTEKIRIECEEISNVKKKLDITVSADVVEEQIKEAYRNVRANASIAGFRKGAVPMNILKSRFDGYVQEEVIKKIVEQAYPHALHEKGLAPIAPPKMDFKSPRVEEGKEFSFTATVEVTPKIEVTGYREMELSSKPVDVTDGDVEEALKNLTESKVQFKEVKRAAKDGDLVVVEFEGFMDGKPIKHGKSENYPIIIGEKTLLPGFDEALKGAVKGDEREAEVTFPENYSEEAARGKKGLFKIKVKGVRAKLIPDLDNKDFLKSLECDSVETLKTRMREELKYVKESQEKERLKNEILDKLLSANGFDVPDAMVDRYLSATLANVLSSMKQGGGNIDDRGLSPDDLKAKYRKVSERQVREDILLDSIAAAEKVEASDDDVDAAVKRLADARGVTFEALMTRIRQESAVDVIKDGIKHEKVFDIILGARKPAV